ncbi:MAG: DUF5615 family PIN-like protein [Phycisphaerae bacterium]|nr:DUF5615 family PIN-like protein [Phycisphaerae bacterium]
MNLLADENFPAPVTEELRALGHNLVAVAETMRGASDAVVLSVAVREHRLLLTLDRDYGDFDLPPRPFRARGRRAIPPHRPQPSAGQSPDDANSRTTGGVGRAFHDRDRHADPDKSASENGNPLKGTGTTSEIRPGSAIEKQTTSHNLN